MKLSANQERILKEYADKCSPSLFSRGEDFYILCEARYIHKEQNHITDKGLAYVVSEMDYPFVEFINKHKWEGRLKTFLDFARREFKTDQELNLYFKEKYRQNLDYETWGPDGQERQLPPNYLKEFTAKMFLNLLKYPQIDWIKVNRLFVYAGEQAGFTWPPIESKAGFEAMLNHYLAATMLF